MRLWIGIGIWLGCMVGVLDGHADETHRMAWIGDSLSVDFEFHRQGAMLKALWTQGQAKGMVVDRSNPALISIEEHLRGHHALLTIDNYSRAGSSITLGNSWTEKHLMRMQTLEEQVDRMLRPASKRYDSVVFWVGHNDVSRVEAHPNLDTDCFSDKEILCHEVEDVLARYTDQIEKVRALYQDVYSGHPLKIFVIGLVDFSSFFPLHDRAWSLHQSDPDSFPYIEISREAVHFLQQPYRDQAMLFATSFNEILASWVANQLEINPSSMAVQYAGSVAQTLVGGLAHVSADGFHPSQQGKNFYAKVIADELIQLGLFELH
jgi:lysophospholipase L1-like esterase